MKNDKIASELVRLAKELIGAKLNIKGRGRGRDVGVQVWNDISTQDDGIGKMLGYVLRGSAGREFEIKDKGSAGSPTGVYFDWFAGTENKQKMQDILGKIGWKQKGNKWVYSGSPFELYVDDKHALGSLVFGLSADYSYVYDTKNKTWKVYKGGTQVY